MFVVLMLLLVLAFPAQGGGVLDFTVDEALTNGSGWVYNDLAYASGRGFHFKKDGAEIVSPRLDLVITQIVLRVSATGTTRPLFLDYGGATELAIEYTEAESDSFLEVPAELASRSFRIYSGAATGCYIYPRRIVVRGYLPVAAPTDIVVSEVSALSCRLRWHNVGEVARNRVTLYRCVDMSADVALQEYDFGFLQGKGSNNDRYGEIKARYPGLDGRNWYAAANTNGIFQLGTGKELGLLLLPAAADYTNVVLRMAACRHETDDTFRNLQLGYVLGGVTNSLTSHPVPQGEIIEFDIDVASAAPGSRLLVNNDTASNGRRLLIRSMALVRRSGTASEEVPVKSFDVVSPPNEVLLRVNGLAPMTAYRFGISEENGGDWSQESRSDGFTTPDDSGMMFMIQ